ncbi:MAG: adenylosuccinate synthase [Bacillota bacterium]|nr:adenylosuccinate synthase [Bacillota bacterium]
MSITAIVGANWGDEGKGKLTDALAAAADIVIRFQGGANAGHTIVNQYGKFALHQLPSGVFHSHVVNVIGNGAVFSPENFRDELAALEQAAVPRPRLLLSERAQLVMPYHKLFDAYEEQRLAGRSFGSTRSGIAPAYADKFAKTGFQLCELLEADSYLADKAAAVCAVKNTLLEHLYHQPLLDPAAVAATLREYRELLKPYIGDSFAYLHQAVREGKRILLEGQLGALKDVDFGIYPMVTSSNTIAAYGAVGAGLPPGHIGRIIAVVKAYSSAVGGGEFVSEIFGEQADELRKRGGDGGEYGATTGRPRRMGWLDLVASRYGVRVQSATEVAFTVLDALSYLPQIPVCVAYEIDGEQTTDFPATPRLKKARPVLKVLEGWNCDIRGVSDYHKLPQAAREYIEFAERFIGVPFSSIGNGPRREHVIRR